MSYNSDEISAHDLDGSCEDISAHHDVSGLRRCEPMGGEGNDTPPANQTVARQPVSSLDECMDALSAKVETLLRERKEYGANEHISANLASNFYPDVESNTMLSDNCNEYRSPLEKQTKNKFFGSENTGVSSVVVKNDVTQTTQKLAVKRYKQCASPNKISENLAVSVGSTSSVNRNNTKMQSTSCVSKNTSTNFIEKDNISDVSYATFSEELQNINVEHESTSLSELPHNSSRKYFLSLDPPLLTVPSPQKTKSKAKAKRESLPRNYYLSPDFSDREAERSWSEITVPTDSVHIAHDISSSRVEKEAEKTTNQPKRFLFGGNSSLETSRDWKSHVSGNHSMASTVELKKDSICHTCQSFASFSDFDRETPPLSASSIASSSKRLEWDNGADIGYHAIDNKSPKDLSKIIRREPEGISFVDEGANTNVVSSSQSAFKNLPFASMKKQPPQLKHKTFSDTSADASNFESDESSSGASLSRSDSKKSVIYTSIRDVRSQSDSVKSKKQIRKSSFSLPQNSSCPNLTDVLSIAELKKTKASPFRILSKSDEYVVKNDFTKMSIIPIDVEPDTSEVEQTHVINSSVNDRIKECNDAVTDPQHDSSQFCQNISQTPSIIEAGDSYIMDSSSDHSYESHESDFGQGDYDHENSHVFSLEQLKSSEISSGCFNPNEIIGSDLHYVAKLSDLPKECQLHFMDSRPLLVLSNNLPKSKEDDLLMSGNIFQKNNDSDQHPKAHIRWYPFPSVHNPQDIKDVSTQTAVSFLTQKEETKNLSSPKPKYIYLKNTSHQSVGTSFHRESSMSPKPSIATQLNEDIVFEESAHTFKSISLRTDHRKASSKKLRDTESCPVFPVTCFPADVSIDNTVESIFALKSLENKVKTDHVCHSCESKQRMQSTDSMSSDTIPIYKSPDVQKCVASGSASQSSEESLIDQGMMDFPSRGYSVPFYPERKDGVGQCESGNDTTICIQTSVVKNSIENSQSSSEQSQLQETFPIPSNQIAVSKDHCYSVKGNAVYVSVSTSRDRSQQDSSSATQSTEHSTNYSSDSSIEPVCERKFAWLSDRSNFNLQNTLNRADINSGQVQSQLNKLNSGNVMFVNNNDVQIDKPQQIIEKSNSDPCIGTNESYHNNFVIPSRSKIQSYSNDENEAKKHDKIFFTHSKSRKNTKNKENFVIQHGADIKASTISSHEVDYSKANRCSKSNRVLKVNLSDVHKSGTSSNDRFTQIENGETQTQKKNSSIGIQFPELVHVSSETRDLRDKNVELKSENIPFASKINLSHTEVHHSGIHTSTVYQRNTYYDSIKKIIESVGIQVPENPVAEIKNKETLLSDASTSTAPVKFFTVGVQFPEKGLDEPFTKIAKTSKGHLLKNDNMHHKLTASCGIQVGTTLNVAKCPFCLNSNGSPSCRCPEMNRFRTSLDMTLKRKQEFATTTQSCSYCLFMSGSECQCYSNKSLQEAFLFHRSWLMKRIEDRKKDIFNKNFPPPKSTVSQVILLQKSKIKPSYEINKKAKQPLTQTKKNIAPHAVNIKNNKKKQHLDRYNRTMAKIYSERLKSETLNGRMNHQLHKILISS